MFFCILTNFVVCFNSSLSEISSGLSNIKIFPDYNNVIYTISSEGVYTATQDCYIIGRMISSSSDASIICFGNTQDNNKMIGCSNSNAIPYGVCFLLKKGDSIYITGGIINLSVIGIK